MTKTMHPRYNHLTSLLYKVPLFFALILTFNNSVNGRPSSHPNNKNPNTTREINYQKALPNICPPIDKFSYSTPKANLSFTSIFDTAITGTFTNQNAALFAKTKADTTGETENQNQLTAAINWLNIKFAAYTTGLLPSSGDSGNRDGKDAGENFNADFLPEGNSAPNGYVADIGLPFSEERKYGWVNPVTKAPVNLAANMRIRKTSPNAKQRALVQMQAATENQVPGAWEYMVKNGFYKVTVSAGDYDCFDGSNHEINVEGLPVISDFVPSYKERFRVSTATVKVTDGKLTIDAKGGFNTKMNYVNISRAEPVNDTIAPLVNARFSGPVKSGAVYKNQAQVFITASDSGGSGLATLQYALNNGKYVNYSSPLTITKPGKYRLKIKAIDASNNETVADDYKFQIIDATVGRTLSFSVRKLSFTILKGTRILPQMVKITGSPAIAWFSLSKTKADWLKLAKKTSRFLEFGPQNISSDLDAGNYHTLVTCSAEGYKSASLLIDLHVVDAMVPQPINVDFQDPQSEPPLGYVRDYGQAFGKRTDLYQGAGLEYGWRKRSDGSLLDLTANGRNRNTPEDVLLATLVHMQANHIHRLWSGIKTEGYWEIKVPNGIYDVTVSVGDGVLNMAPEYHSINVEGVNAINKFIPNGKKGTISRFKSATVRVNVADEHLTIDADGGTSTKINFASIVPVSPAPNLFWASNCSNIIIKKGSAETNRFSIVLGSSNHRASSYTIGVRYAEGAAKWIKLKTAPLGIQPTISFDYSLARNLPVGIYKATLYAMTPQFTSASFDVQLNVVDKTKPYVVSSSPANGSTKVSLNTVSIAANNLHIPVARGYKGGVNNKTITNSSVKLLKLVDKNLIEVTGVVQGTGGGDAISFTPSASLEANTIYKFVVTPYVKSYTGAEFAPYESTFVTDAAKVDSSNILDAQFTKVAMPGTQNKKYSTLTIGPDGRFYALRLDGTIERYNINHIDGMLTGQKIISTLVKKYGSRSAIGLTFDPKSTPTNLIAWVSHSSAGLSAAPSFDGNISRLSGDSLQFEELAITKLPRSKRDHLVNSMAFGPDGTLYICQGSMSSAGSFDDDWQRDESLLAGTVLRLDVNKLNKFVLPLNVKTTSNQNVINHAPAKSASMRDGTYNPYGSSAPLTIYASGVRNAFDLVWHSNGQLYLPTNGSGGGGNSPASVRGTRRPNGTFYSGPGIPATNGIQAQHDWLFRINPSKPIGYYGHPNPLRGEYVLNRGFEDNPLYLPSVSSDDRYRGGYDFGLNKSPNGALEYKSNTFGGVLKGKLLVCRFSGGGDIAVMEPGSFVPTSTPANDDSIYDIVKVTTGSGNSGLVGMSGFGNPLDIVEDVVNGNLYLIQYNWNDSPNLTSQIILLRAHADQAPLTLTTPANKPARKIQKKSKK
ncbi:Ig-like domain-containing protein [Dyadobacter sp. NIV53]|uniref:Ig-like domain-containing protein n=1 Tax=Dyadobacter sp. NIV53 TaxID=2861765 RepID=UPI001C8831BC|nr:Ig-like domain-containing protein [Dyadobacter sp. NIV53]